MIALEFLPVVIDDLQSIHATEFEYETGEVRISIRLKARHTGQLGDSASEHAAEADGPAAYASTVTVFSPDMGYLCLAHPLAIGPMLNEGDRVAREDTVAFLRIGDALVPILAGVDGRLLCWHAADGELAGYGSAIMDIERD